MSHIARRLVSKKKRRFQDKELSVDLDLTYITPRILAMGFPSRGKEGLYRNKMSDVKRFLDTRHPHKYRIYNLCSEKTYEQTEFFQVERFPFDDHQAPPFDIMLPFCRSAQEWMKSDPENIVVVHCKAGKGRTGVMICAFLIYSGMQPDDAAAMDFYAEARTYNRQGVTIRSQRRYIRYFNTYLKNTPPCQYPHPGQTLFLEKIVLNNPPKGLPNLTYKVKDRDGGEVIVCKAANTRERTITVLPGGGRGVALRGDLKFSFKEHRPLLAGRGKDIFHFWINTFFIDGNYLRIPKMEIDRAYKDRRFGIDFSVDLHFASTDHDKAALVGVSSSSSSGGSLPSLGKAAASDNDISPASAHVRPGEAGAESSPPSSSPQVGPVAGAHISDHVGHGSMGNEDEHEDYYYSGSGSGSSSSSSSGYDSSSDSSNETDEISDPDQLLEDLEEEYRSHTLS